MTLTEIIENKTFENKTFENISYVFNTRPELIETITDIYNLRKPSEIYMKMCELGYKFNWREFIKNGK